jgi:hypothetical protein
MPAFSGIEKHGKAYGLALLGKTVVQVQTTHVKGQFHPQHFEKAQNVIRRLSERISDDIQTPVPQV